jgi:ATP-dependent Clp protease ATP-binding subunit ClpC
MVSLTFGASLAWQIASIEAHEARDQFIEKEHLFIGVCSLEKVLANGEIGLEPAIRHGLDAENSDLEASFRELELSSTVLRRRIRQLMGKGMYERIENIIHRSEECKKIFSDSENLAGSEISTLHLLATILEKPGPVIEDVLTDYGVNASELRDNVLKRLSTRHDYFGGLLNKEQPAEKVKSEGYLDNYGRDLTAEARAGKLEPFFVRKKELIELIVTFNRCYKNNPVLVGSAGVYKTSIVEALAVQIAEGNVPGILSDKKIIELNMDTLIGGVRSPGDFEDLMVNIIAEARARQDVILFIDEIHSIVGIGINEGGPMNTTRMLKSAFTHSDLRCIGATTEEQYHKYIESAPSLERRFDKVIVEELGRDETIEVLRTIRPKLEKHYGVKITNEALESVVDLSIRFDPKHHLPDNVIDLVDRAISRIRLPDIDIKENPRQILVEAEEGTECVVTGVCIARMVSEKMGVPIEVVLGHLKYANSSWLPRIESFLKSRVMFQGEAIELICQHLLIAYSGLKSRNGPLAVFLFLGPIGVGRTKTAKSLAEFLFGDHSNLIRLDMSEYKEEQSVSKLIGSLLGNIGHNEEGQLTCKLRSQPYSVVLLDNIEKANPKVLDIFFQAFEEGRIIDSKGRVVDARNAIFIMKSSIDVGKHRGVNRHEIEESSDIPPNSSRILKFSLINQNKERYLKGLDSLGTEFINRIDEIIIFNPLSKDEAAKILRPMLEEMKKTLTEQYGVVLHTNEELEREIASMGYSPEYGIRELRRTMERLIQVPLSQLIISGELDKHKEWQAYYDNYGISIKPVS